MCVKGIADQVNLRKNPVFEGVRYDWEAGDTISPPANQWHQHFNSEHDKAVIYLTVTNDLLLEAMGIVEEPGELI